jgi:predicted dehydrogenase
MSHGLSIGVVGLGYWGPNLARNFSQLQGCDLKALCDLDPDRLEKMGPLYPGIARFSSFERMLRDTDLDAVAVATPMQHHFPLAKAALVAGKHVLVEKPFASSVTQCEELIQLAGSRGLTLMVGHTFLYSAPIQMIKRIIDSGDLGDIRYINSQRLNLGLFQKDINVVWDLAPHDISIILYLLGRMPEFVNCQGNAHITPGIEDVTNLSLSFKSGQFATIQSSWLEPRKVRQMTIVGTRKMIVYDDIEPMEKIRIYDTRIERPPHYDNFGEFHYSYHYGDSFVPYIEQSEPLRQMCQHFVSRVQDGAPSLSCGRQGLQVWRILEASSQSLKSNGAAVNVAASPLPSPGAAASVSGTPKPDANVNGHYNAGCP